MYHVSDPERADALRMVHSALQDAPHQCVDFVLDTMLPTVSKENEFNISFLQRYFELGLDWVVLQVPINPKLHGIDDRQIRACVVA